MAYRYEADPRRIERESFRRIRACTELAGLDREQQQVAMRVVHSAGIPALAAQLRFSAHACARGREALATASEILCDVEMVRQGITRRLVDAEPRCFLRDPEVPAMAESAGETRTMAALRLWQPYLAGSIVVIGNAPTALFRLLEMLEQGASRPALVIGIPVGFVGAAESKQALWEAHKVLGIECITLLGTEGGSAVAAAVCNALLRCNYDEWY